MVMRATKEDRQWQNEQRRQAPRRPSNTDESWVVKLEDGGLVSDLTL
jgi:hypothetical protein